MGLDLYFEKHKIKEIGYFRKVNFLVPFFQFHNPSLDNLDFMIIDKEIAEDLLSRCNKVLENRENAEKFLPTTSGFFFGSTEYDEYYIKDVEAVQDFCKNELIPALDNLKDDEKIMFRMWY